MRRRLALLLLTTAVSAVPAVAPVSARGDLIAQAACLHTKIGGQSKCIARGQFCARHYERDYVRHGLSCTKRDVNGRYHLR